jgi:hypothetical protein
MLISLAQWLEARDRSRFDDDEGDLVDDWAESVTPEYLEILEAVEVEDSNPQTLATVLAAGILVTAWLFDRAKAQYLKPKNRKPIDPDILEQLARDRITTAKQKLDVISREYQSSLSKDRWEFDAKVEIEKLHTDLYTLGRGGSNQLTKQDKKVLRRILQEQFDYLKAFRGSLDQISDLRAINRLRNYAQSGAVTFLKGRDAAISKSAYTMEQWVLGVAEHCNGCVEQSAKGRVPIGSLPAIGTQECLFNCQCRKRYF